MAPVPTSAIERLRERGEDNVAPDAATRNNVAVPKPSPPEPPVRENRPETPERVEGDRRGRLNEPPEDSTSNVNKGSGKAGKGSQIGKG